MPYIEWDDKLSVHVAEIDAQHKKIIEAINRLHEAMLDNRAEGLQKSIIYEMYDYAFGHFATEEEYMRRFGYPEAEMHRREHEQFTRQAEDFKRKMEQGERIPTIVILKLLKEWLHNHVLHTDLKCAEHFRRQRMTK
jgi:hemerythrin